MRLPKLTYVLLILLASALMTAQNVVGEPFTGDPGHRTGEYVAISADGNRIAISDQAHETNGAVRVYDLVDGSWVQAGQTLHGRETNQDFGNHLRLSADGSRLVCVDYWTSTDSNPPRVAIYDWADGSWERQPSQFYAAGPTNSNSHLDLSSDGKTIAVASIHVSNDSTNERRGTVSVFRQLDNGEWRQLGPSFTGSRANAYLGTPTALSGNGELIVMAEGFFTNEQNRILAYRWDGSTWNNVLDERLPVPSQQFLPGIATDDRGTTVAVVSPNEIREDGGLGVVHVYRADCLEFANEEQQINTTGDQLRTSIALSGNGRRLFLTEVNVSANGRQWSSDWVYYNLTGGSFEFAMRVEDESPDLYRYDGLIGRLNADGNRLIVGASSFDFQSDRRGLARVYDLPGETETRDSVTDLSGLLFFQNPNLSDGRICIEVDNTTSFARGYLRLYDIKGRLLRTNRVESARRQLFYLDGFPKGSYVLQFERHGEVGVRRLIVR